jgi:hypothetical protein
MIWNSGKFSRIQTGVQISISWDLPCLGGADMMILPFPWEIALAIMLEQNINHLAGIQAPLER